MTDDLRSSDSTPSETKDDSLNIWASLLTIGLFVVMALAKMAESWGGLAAASIYTAMVAAAFVVLHYFGRSSSYRFRAGVVIFGYFLAMITFAWIYLVIYQFDPDSFHTTASAVELRRAEENLAQNLPRSSVLEAKLKDLDALRQNPTAVLRAAQASTAMARNPLSDETGSSRVKFTTVSPEREIMFGHAWHAAKEPYHVDVLIVRGDGGQHYLNDVESTMYGPERDYRVVGLLEAKDEKAIQKLLEDWHSRVKQEFDSLEREIEQNRLGKSQRSFFDFCYFSTVTITTMGYGDIVPNSWWARLFVMTEVFFGVGYIAFNIQLLWKAKGP